MALHAAGGKLDEDVEEQSIPSGPDRTANAKLTISRLQEGLDFIVSLIDLADDVRIDSGQAAALVEGMAEDLDVDIFDDPEVSFPDYADGERLEDVKWTAAYLKTCLSVICEHSG